MFDYNGQNQPGMYQNQYPGQYPMTPNPMLQAPPRRHEIIHVNGANSAQAFRMLPNSQCLLLDDTAPLVWLAVSDGTGYSTVTPFQITPYQPNAPQAGGFEERLRNVEMKLEEMLNVKSDTANAGKSHSTRSSADTGGK